MKKSILLFFISLTVFLLILSSCSAPKPNNFMLPGTKEYIGTTGNLEGTWNVIEYNDKNENFLKNFEKATLTFDFKNKVLKLEATVPKEYIESSLKDWKAKWPDLKVTSYKVIINATCSISNSGEIIYVDEQKVSVEIKGSGENLESYIQMENGKAMIPFGNPISLKKLDSQFNFKLSGKTLHLSSFSGYNILLKK
ncbi:hypothetical protein OSSY52_21110 [Tepiditoga spiralis]|uniref:Lipocalin-like domain-containing protein n=1 Tax=Tepiditoga spiralis TaxID=2108365 RepID=A0A7G1G5U0_9BACT|nr:hypothetical protein [Tepiditoga spiralis]BBE31970.1 hypothetical protein OSSY52_21110 [Tepiditoga spiralis]